MRVHKNLKSLCAKLHVHGYIAQFRGYFWELSSYGILKGKFAIFRIACFFRKYGHHSSSGHRTLHFLSNLFISSGTLEVEASVLLYRQCMCLCQFWCNISPHRATVLKPNVNFNLHICIWTLHMFPSLPKASIPRYAAMFMLVVGCLISDT
jgi:hypothetical protein